MKKVIILLASAFIIYFIVWTITYIVLMGFDLKHYIEYFRLSWSNPGEIPAFIRFVSLLATGILLICILFWMKYRN